MTINLVDMSRAVVERAKETKNRKSVFRKYLSTVKRDTHDKLQLLHENGFTKSSPIGLLPVREKLDETISSMSSKYSKDINLLIKNTAKKITNFIEAVIHLNPEAVENDGDTRFIEAGEYALAKQSNGQEAIYSFTERESGEVIEVTNNKSLGNYNVNMYNLDELPVETNHHDSEFGKNVEFTSNHAA